ncbi:MAG: hypothetical protein A3H98_06845 [Bacteroidetes bacterium RIFCSPLOWO2_02_FULL_36_8]|nr:MAG: hypothetical protein A3H98_06845 [Bacteroidetes bacterium RIFCSPLOWO2_02_FULL_36_8]OFY71850.1 MAG: hypothetical protein A3G23_04810 [Bacteroidetes bacterium RIFCSPLOWO2_12_FULL_37_12]
MKTKVLLFIAVIFLIGYDCKTIAQSVTDIDGNVYNTVVIGTQEWMKENLKVTRYQNGDSIGTTSDTLDVSGETTPKYQWRAGNSDSTLAIYGRHYTWYAATDSRNICPSGWKVPSIDDWGTLITLFGGKDSAGGHLKETGTDRWNSPNLGADNSSGFSALPGGAHGKDVYAEIGRDGVFWTSSPFFSTYAHVRKVFNYDFDVYEGGNSMWQGSSIRCIYDGTTGLKESLNENAFVLIPNPSSGKFTLNATSKINSLEIINVLGKKVTQSVIPDGVRNFNIDISNQPRGIYFMQLKEGGKIYNQKIVVQ